MRPAEDIQDTLVHYEELIMKLHQEWISCSCIEESAEIRTKITYLKGYCNALSYVLRKEI